MKPIMLIGLVHFVLGAALLAYQGFSYTTHEKIIEIGPIHASASTKSIPVPPLVGGAGWRNGHGHRGAQEVLIVLCDQSEIDGFINHRIA